MLNKKILKIIQEKLLKYSNRHNFKFEFLQQELLDNIYLMNENSQRLINKIQKLC